MKGILENWLKDNQVKVTSPVIGAFISSWILFNWDRFLLLFWGEGKLPERLKQFQETTNFSDSQFWFWPLFCALLYVFGLPYLNVLTQKAKRHAELLRHSEIIDTDIEKEKKLAELNEEKYKSNPENEYLGKKIQFELEQKEAEVNKAKADADQKNAEAEKQGAEAKQAQALAEMDESTAKTDKLELEKLERVTEKEKQAHELAKAKHINELATLRFPTVYQYIKRLSEELADEGIILKLNTLENAVAKIFGYSTAEKLVTDNNFTQSKLSELSFVVYNSSTLFNELKTILDEDGTDVITENELFDYLIVLFEYIEHVKLISTDSLEDQVISYIEDNGFNILDLDAVNGCMAETNAIFDEISEFIVTSSNVDLNDGICAFDMEGTVSGTSDENKPFSGDTIDVEFTLSYKKLIGNGFGELEYIDVKAEPAHPDNHSYHMA